MPLQHTNDLSTSTGGQELERVNHSAAWIGESGVIGDLVKTATPIGICWDVASACHNHCHLICHTFSHDIFPSFMFILLGMFGYVWLAQGSGTKQSQRHHVVLDLVGPGGLDPRLGGCGGHQSIPFPRPLGCGGVGPGSEVWAIGFAAERQLQLDWRLSKDFV